MNSINLALRNMKTNFKVYWLHFAALIFSVMVYYQFVTMKYNPQVLAILSYSEISSLSYSAAFVLLVFIIFFTWFSSSFFLGQRKKEIGLYTLMGVTNYKIAFIYAMENFFLNLFAIIVGCGAGSLLGKLFMMIIAKYCNLGMTVDFFISFEAIKETVITFIILAILTSLKGYICIVKSSLLQLINAVKEEETMPRANIFTGILAVAILGTGYYTSTLAINLNFSIFLLVTVILVIIGTYMFFRSGMTLLLRFMINNKNILYRRINILTISNLCYRIRRNYKVYATLAILLASTITSFGTVASLKYSNSSLEEIKYPFTFFYVTSYPEEEAKFSQLVEEEGMGVAFENRIKHLAFRNVKIGQDNYDVVTVAKYSDYEKIIHNLQYKFTDDVLIPTPLQDDQALFNRRADIVMSTTIKGNAIIDDEEFKIFKDFKSPLFGNGYGVDTLLVNDSTYERLSHNATELIYHGITVNEKVDDSFKKKLLESIPMKIENEQSFSYLYFSQDHMGDDPLATILGIVFILGAFLALVLIMASGSIIYFKIINEASEDEEKYAILNKIGTSKDQIKKAVTIQIGVSFITPLFVAIIHSLVALKALEQILGVVIQTPTMISIGIITTIFFLYFLLTRNHYMKQIYKNTEEY